MDKVKIVMVKGEKGDSGDAGDYSGLTNKPQINGITLEGNKTSSDFGFVTSTEAQIQSDAIAALGNRMTAAESNINAVDTRIDEVETTFDARLDALEYVVMNGDVTRENLPSGAEDYSHYSRVGRLITVNFAGYISPSLAWDSAIISGLPRSADVESFGVIAASNDSHTIPVIVGANATTLRLRKPTTSSQLYYMGQLSYIAAE